MRKFPARVIKWRLAEEAVFSSTRAKHGGFALVEAVIATGIFAVTLLGIFGMLAAQQRQAALNSQAELAQAVLRERLELIKGVESFANIRYSTSNSPAYLKRRSDGSWDTNWKIPEANQWLPFSIEDVDAAAADPPLIPTASSPLPQCQWNLVITPRTGGANIVASVRWHLRAGQTRWYTQTLTTDVSSNFVNL